MIDISVVIPFYNRSDLIQRCIKSVESQSLKPREVVIVDDLSAPSEITKLQEFLHQYVESEIVYHLLITDEKLYGAAARNLGIKKAKYDYIALLDSDDEWLHNHLECSSTMLKNSQADLVYSSYLIDNGYTRKEKLSRNIRDDEKPIDFVLSNFMPQTSSFFFNKKNFYHKGISFDESLKRHQDFQFLCLALENATCIHTNTFTTIVHWHKNEKRNVDFKSCQSFIERYESIINHNIYYKYLSRMFLLADEYDDSINKKYYKDKIFDLNISYIYKLMAIDPMILKILLKLYLLARYFI